MGRARKPKQPPAIWVRTEQLVPWIDNPMVHSPDQIARLCQSIVTTAYDAARERGQDPDADPGCVDLTDGWGNPLQIRLANQEIIAGHGRLLAAHQLGIEWVPCRPLGISETQAHRLARADNRIAELAEWDEEKLLQQLQADIPSDEELAHILDEAERDAAAIEASEAIYAQGFDQDYIDALLQEGAGGTTGDNGNGELPTGAGPSLVERFGVPPFSVLDARQGYWQSRKAAWIGLGIQSEVGRGAQPNTPAPVGQGGLSDRVSGSKRRKDKPKLESETGRKWSTPDARAELFRRGQIQQSARATGAFRSPDGDYEYPVEQLQKAGGTSIFDPVLCELAYRWFSPPGGAVLDPFAGGSVRGIVAAALGRRYTGIELRPEQVAANREQWAEIGPRLGAQERREVKVSAKMARLRFPGCSPDYIASTCRATCCESSKAKTGTLITVHPSEEAAIRARGGVVSDGMLQPRPGERRCPFKTEANLCGLHDTPDKPFGCIASPFTLNAKGTLIVRNRYKTLRCYKDGGEPAYRAFATSLVLLFGQAEAKRITAHFDDDGGDIMASMPERSWRILRDNDALKHGGEMGAAAVTPTWIEGDSRQQLGTIDDESADLVFTCPPYGNLEVYSDIPEDLSAMSQDDMLKAYRDIAAQAVAKLRPDRFAVVVVGDYRRRDGNMSNFVSETIAAFEAAGAPLYNEGILVTSVGSLPVRAGKVFEASRKLGKTHQNVLVFVKGDARNATEACGKVEFTTAGNGFSPEVEAAA